LGDGEERHKLEQLIRDFNIEHVVLAGFRQFNELPAYYGLASVFIHPALQEQWGLVVNEAMASGLPVIVSDRCGCAPELVNNGVNGFTFSPENIQQLADLMCRYSLGEYDCNKMGKASFSIIGNWGVERFASSLYQAVQTAIH